MEDNKREFFLTDERIDFCLKRLRSYRQSRIFSPMLFLIFNYFFIYGFFGFENYFRTLIIYIIFTLTITSLVYLITTAAIKRYSNIIKQITFKSEGTFEITSLLDDVFVMNKGDYKLEEGELAEKRYTRFETLVMVVNNINYTIVPEWFGEDSQNIRDGIMH